MSIAEITGFVAATLTTIAFIPQAFKVWRTKSTKDLSPSMFLLLFTGIILWLVYGLLIHKWPIIISNIVTIFFAAIILFYIIRFDKSVHIHHVAFWVHDIEMMKDFYIHNFNAKAGAKYENTTKGFSSYFLSFSTGVKLEIMSQPGKYIAGSNNNHLSVSLGSKERVDLITEEFEKKGIKIISHPRYTGDGFYESAIKDPEGNIIELTVC